MKFPPGFKTRMGSLICTWWRRTCYTFPEIHIWCNTANLLVASMTAEPSLPCTCEAFEFSDNTQSLTTLTSYSNASKYLKNEKEVIFSENPFVLYKRYHLAPNSLVHIFIRILGKMTSFSFLEYFWYNWIRYQCCQCCVLWENSIGGTRNWERSQCEVRQTLYRLSYPGSSIN